MFKPVAIFGLSVVLASGAATAAAQQKPAKAAERQYCFTFASDTGSHLTRTECHTKKEWKQLGVDVDEVLRS